MSVDIFPFSVWQSGTNENSIPANDNALRNEVLAKGALGVADTEPVDPEGGDVYIVGVSWGSFGTDHVVVFIGGTWIGFNPFVGWAKTIGARLYFYNGSGWVEIEGGGAVISPTVTIVSVISGVVDLSGVEGDTVSITLTENVTSIIYPPGVEGFRKDLMIRLAQDAVGGHTIDLSGIEWDGDGLPPNVNDSPSGVTYITAVNVDDIGWEGFK